MNYLLSYAHFFASILFLVLGFIIIIKDSRSQLNQACSAVMLCFFIWSFSTTIVQHPASSEPTARFFGSIATVGWLFFSVFHLWFAWLYSKQKVTRFVKVVAGVLICIPVLLLVMQWSSSALIVEFQHLPYGWFTPWTPTIWPYIFFIYLFATSVAGFWMIFDYGRKSDNVVIKRQALIIIITGSITLVFGFQFNIILTLFIPDGNIPPIGDITLLIWASGLAYVAIRYNVLNITPFIAANKIITTMKDLLFLLDTHGYIMSVNASAQATLRCKGHVLIGRHFSELVVDGEEQCNGLMSAVLKEAVFTGETSLSCAPGIVIPVAVSTSLITGTGVVCVAHDISLQKQRTESLREAKKQLEVQVSKATEDLQITNARLMQEVLEKKQAAAALVESEERFRVIFECAPDSIYLIDPEGNVVDANNEALRIVGYQKDDFIGKNIGRMGVLSEADLASVNEMLVKGGDTDASLYQEIALVNKGGTTVPAEISLHPLNIGEKVLNVCIVRDLSQRKKAEKEAEELKLELHHAQKMDAIGRLAGGIAHDFNNLLGGIIGYAGLLRKKLVNVYPAEAEVLQKIMDVAKQASDRTAQLLAFARKGKYRVEPVNMHDLINDVTSLMEHTIDPRIVLESKCLATRAVVSGDRSQLHSALLNLGVNARDAIPGGGSIVFSTENIAADALPQRFRSELTGELFLCIRVTDNGTGMDEATKSRIFEPFFSTKEEGKGTGLGLPSVYGTVIQHNGSIDLETEPGKGTSFFVLLPVVEATIVEKETIQEVLPEVACKSETILVVDDTPLIREMMVDALEDMGYTIHSCEDGMEALSWFKSNYSTCHLVVLDFTMPEINGKECFNAMKAIDPSVKAIITSGHAIDGEIENTLKAGVRAFLQKPFEIEVLGTTVRQVLSESGDVV